MNRRYQRTATTITSDGNRNPANADTGGDHRPAARGDLTAQACLDQLIEQRNGAAELMYPHIEQAAEVCVEEADQFLIEGFELAPTHPARLKAVLPGTNVRACFLSHRTFSADDRASYRGPKPQHETQASRTELDQAAAWIRQRSHQLHAECRKERLPYVDVGTLGFQAAMQQAGRLLLRHD